MVTNSTQTASGDPVIAACADIAAQHDRERWLAAGLAAAPMRAELAVLIAFNAEIARTRDLVSEPMLGLIRLQWWRETIETAAQGSPREHPVAAGLAALLARGNLAAQDLLALVDGREQDIETEGINSLDDFLAYTASTAGAFNRAALKLLGAGDAASLRAGALVARAVGCVGQLRAVAANAARGRVLLPRAWIGGYGVSIPALLAGKPGPGLAAVARELADMARADLAAARAMRRDVAAAALPVLATARFADRHLARLAKARYDLFSRLLEPPPVVLPLAAGRAMLTRRY